MDLLGEVQSQLKQARTRLGELEEAQAEIIIKLTVAGEDVAKLEQAYQALSGTTSQRAGDYINLPSAPQPVQPAPQAAPRIPAGAMECGSCNGAMFHQSRTLQSGRVVQLWVCGDCSNERL